MTTYLDANVVVPLFVTDTLARSAVSVIAKAIDPVISDFVACEFAAIVGIRVRTRVLTQQEALNAFANFDRWVTSYARRIDVVPDDIRGCERLLRRLDLGLRAPDAIHLVIVQRLGAQFATFDRKLAAAARKLSMSVV